MNANSHCLDLARKPLRSRLFTALFVMWLTGTAARAEIVPLKDMQHRAWTTQDGVPSSIQDAVIGPDGFLWLISPAGLFRFDGISFHRYRPPTGNSLPSDAISSILAATDGSIWLSYDMGGVTRIKGNTVTNLGAKEGLGGFRIDEIAEDKNGRIWIQTAKGLFFFEHGQVEKFKDDRGITNTEGGSLAFDKAGNLWLDVFDLLYVLKPGSKTLIPAGSSYTGCNAAMDAGVICESGSAPVAQFILEGSKVVTRPIYKPASVYNNTAPAHDGSLWIMTSAHGIERLAASGTMGKGVPAPEVFEQKDGLSSNNVGGMLEDAEGSTWVFTDRGLDQFRPATFHNVAIDSTWVLLPSSRHGDPLALTFKQLFDIAPDGPMAIPDLHIVVSKEMPRCTYTADDGTLWIGTTSRLLRYAHGKLESIPAPTDHPPGLSPALPPGVRPLQAIVEDTNHVLWASFIGGGVYRLDGRSWTRQGGRNGLPGTVAFSSLRDEGGHLWFGYPHGGLYEVADGKVQGYTGNSVGNVQALAEWNRHIWLGTEHGLFLLDHGKIEPVALDIADGAGNVSGLRFLSNGDLWINASRGIFKVEANEVAKREADPQHTLEARLFDYRDGVAAVPGTFDGNPSIGMSMDGKLYFAENRHLQWVDPLHIPSNSIPPRASIQRVRVAGNESALPLAGEPARLSADPRDVEFDYSATSLLIPERVRFRYRLVGYDNHWMDAGTRRQISYSKLPPGHYTFEVMASNDSGVWSLSSAKLDVIVPPTFFETMWFRLALLLALAIGLYFLVRYLIQRAQRLTAIRLHERYAERERIARDLHDTLLQDIYGVIFQIDSATAHAELTPPSREQVRTALESANRAMTSARESISGLRKPSDSFDLEGILASINQQAVKRAGTQFQVAVSGQRRDLQPSLFDELLKICNEAIRNACLHAHAQSIAVEIAYTRTGLTISVCDDGVGIAANILEQGGRPGHWGLPGMQERAARIGGRLSVRRRSPGTEVHLFLPAHRAFRFARITAPWNWLRKLASVTTK